MAAGDLLPPKNYKQILIILTLVIMKRFNINRVSFCSDDPDVASLREEPSSDDTTPEVFGWFGAFGSPRSLLLAGGAALSHSGKCHVSDETKRGNNKRTKDFCTIFSLLGETDILILQQCAPHTYCM